MNTLHHWNPNPLKFWHVLFYLLTTGGIFTSVVYYRWGEPYALIFGAAYFCFSTAVCFIAPKRIAEINRRNKK